MTLDELVERLQSLKATFPASGSAILVDYPRPNALILDDVDPHYDGGVVALLARGKEWRLPPWRQ